MIKEIFEKRFQDSFGPIIHTIAELIREYCAFFKLWMVDAQWLLSVQPTTYTSAAICTTVSTTVICKTSAFCYMHSHCYLHNCCSLKTAAIDTQSLYLHKYSCLQNECYLHNHCYLHNWFYAHLFRMKGILIQRTVLIYRERSYSGVECLTRDRRAAGSSLTGVTALWSLSKTHLS